MGELLRRIHYFVHRRRLDAELESDMEFHREMAARQGLGGRDFGNTLRLREQAQEAWGWAGVERFLQDMRWAVRGLRRAPGSALAMVVLLALGMGGVTALFGPLYSLVLRPLPFPDSGRLVRIGGDNGSGLRVDPYASHTFFENRREFAPILSGVMAYSADKETLSGGGPAERIDVATVTPEFFPTLGVRPRLGSGFRVDPEVTYYPDPEDIPAVIVSDQFWRTRLQSTRELGKRLITLNGNRFAVIGVMPPDYDFPAGVQVWRSGKVSPGTSVQVGRLLPGVSMAQAQAGLRAVESRNAKAAGATPLTLESLHDSLLGDRKPLLWILSAVSLLFLALSCAGVANLLLARGVRRRQEMVVRAALGAVRGWLIRQLLTETLLLAAAGGLLGLAFSVLARQGLQTLIPGMLQDADAFPPATIALVIALTLAVTVLCGVAPAFHATGADLNASLKDGNTASGGSWSRLRRISVHELFAGGQLILAMVLLISTGLLLRSMAARLDSALGFDPRNVAVVHADLPQPADARATVMDYVKSHRDINSRAGTEARQAALEPADTAIVERQESFYQEATRRLTELPGVASVAVITTPPFANLPWERFGSMSLAFDDDPSRSKQARMLAWGHAREVSPGAFRILGIRLLAGRDFLPSDIPPPDAWKAKLYHFYDNTPKPTTAVIVNETFASHVWPNQNPLGKTFHYVMGPARVVGVVADIHESRENPKIFPVLYSPYTASTRFASSVTFVVKLRPGAKVADLTKALPPVEAETAPPTALLLQESLGNLPVALALLSCFSVLGIVVAGLGVYATATLMSAARTRETGIRLAIGASAEQVGRLVLWRSLRLALLALPVGAFGAWLLGRNLTHWLYKVGATDPMSYLTSAAILLLIALAAGLWPALRAATTPPSTALRYDG
jgi:putative ABC transport system permease protein